MATANSRDVRLGIEIQTAGEDDIKRLASAVRALGKEGDPAAAEYARLANELDRLSNQSGAIQSLQTLRTDVEKLTASEREAAAAADATAMKYREQAAATEALRAAQADARAEVLRSKAARDELRATLDKETATARAAGLAGQELAKSLAETRTRLAEQTLAFKQRQDALTQANRSVADAERAEARLRTEFERTGATARTTATALGVQADALARAEAAAVKFGANIDALENAEVSFRAALGATVAELTAFDAGVLEGAAATRALEDASKAADRAMTGLVAELRSAESAAEQYAAATERATTAGASDAATTRARVAAATALIESERALTIGQAELADQRDRNRAALLSEASALLAQQRALEAAAESTRRLVADSARLGTTIEGTGRALGRAGTLAEEAFGKVGVRSLQAVEREVADTERALSLLERRFQAGALGARDLERATGAAAVKLALLAREAQQVQALPNAFERISGSINTLLTRFGALGAAVATVGVAVRPVLDATVALDQMRRVLTTVTGSAAEAERQISFLRRTSQESGQSFTEVGQSYAKFAASALQSGLTIKDTQEVFRSVSLAAGNLGLSSDQAKRALEALSQIASKGVVSMEELRQQLGDALPGVLPLLAKELGLTQRELNKLVESGDLLASEAIPAIGRALVSLQAQGGQVEGLVANFNRFKNAILAAGTAITDGPIGKVAGTILLALGGAVTGVAATFVALSEAITVTGRTIGLLTAAVTGSIGSFQQFKDEFAAIFNESGQRLDEFSQNTLGAQRETKALGAEVAKLGDSFAKLALDQQAQIDAATLAAQTATKNVQARKAEADGIAVLAGLLGDEVAARDAAAVAARNSAAATQELADADARVVATLTAARDATIAKAQADGINADAIKATVAALDTKIAKATADAETTQAQAAAARAHTLALDLSTQAAADNSGRIDELRKNVEAAELALQSKIRALRLDATTQAEVQKATEDLAVAKGLLRDAIDDVEKALKRQVEAMRAEQAVTKASLDLEIARAKNAVVAARARGDETAALEASIRVRELEQNLIESSLDLKTNEAAATLRAIETQRIELEASGQLTAEKAAELDVRKKLAQAQAIEAEAGKENNRTQRAQVEALKDNTSARGDLTRAVDGSTGALETNTRAARDNGLALTNLSRAALAATQDAQRLGITLENAVPGAAARGVEASLRAFERLKSGGIATAGEVNRAFLNLAAQATAAAGGIVPEWVKVEAQFRNAVVELDEFGKGAVRAAAAGEQAGQTISRAFDQVAGSLTVAAEKLDVFSAAAIKARNEGESLSTLGSNKYDKDGIALDSTGKPLVATGQVNVPQGAVFDQAAFDRAQRSANLSGLKPPNPADYYVQPSPSLRGYTPEELAGLRQSDPGGFNGSNGYTPFGSYGRQQQRAATPTPTSTVVPAGTVQRVAVDITLNGRSFGSVNTASIADATALQGLLRQLTEAAAAAAQP